MPDPSEEIEIISVFDESDGSTTYVMDISYEIANDTESLEEVLDSEGFIQEDDGVWKFESE